MTDGSGSDSGFGRSTAGLESGAVAAFAAAWESADPAPAISDYLPDAETLRLDALIELIRVDLRQRWLRRPALTPSGGPEPPRKLLRNYCAEFAELSPDRVPASRSMRSS